MEAIVSLPGWRDNPYVSTSVSAADIGPRQGIMSTVYRGVSGWTVVTSPGLEVTCYVEAEPKSLVLLASRVNSF